MLDPQKLHKQLVERLELKCINFFREVLHPFSPFPLAKYLIPLHRSHLSLQAREVKHEQEAQ